MSGFDVVCFFVILLVFVCLFVVRGFLGVWYVCCYDVCGYHPFRLFISMVIMECLMFIGLPFRVYHQVVVMAYFCSF